ncbi:hypothetical protein Pint_01679 [Pistacia integerrima]|uniref:Uncharacterized protein n=1 Tax=Pistacia integerrima TaxID=434235 RepID=A0ACC0ZMJ4_9ROSI|nr:hypothetical protein Pint_01679 [Pistacia integerrima]
MAVSTMEYQADFSSIHKVLETQQKFLRWNMRLTFPAFTKVVKHNKSFYDGITASPRTQAEALIKWKNTFSFQPSSLASWSLTNINNLCSWTSIVCDSAGTVSEINLSGENITGVLTEFNFTEFATLTRFDLSSNNIDGDIPSAIGSLANLAYLDLSSNFFEGIIPSDIARLTELEYLNLFDNYFNGTVPHQLSNLQKVWYIDLGANLLESPDWSNFSAMPSLQHLSLYYNELHLEFPSFVLNCRNLTYLDLSLNKLSGQIPELVFTNLGKLQYLNLTENQFHGPLSTIISKLSNLVQPSLCKIPSSLGQLKKLQMLDLHLNALNSTIPSELGLCTNLTYLALAKNQLSGELQNNSFTGKIPPEIGLLTNLNYPLPVQFLKHCGISQTFKAYNFSSNNLNGTIPPEIENLASLATFDVNTNQLYGELPQNISGLPSLKSISLFTNNFSGSIPRDFGKHIQLTYVCFSNLLRRIAT